MSKTTLSCPDTEKRDRILCCYQNTTRQIELVRVFDDLPHVFEKVVFPGERLLFEASLYAEVQIYTNAADCSNPASRILCSQLQVCEPEQ